ncbi:MAG: putative O-glycosylation ligase, exosortase A system-associated [Nitrospirae bacterium]|nr:MAG: putative O-glycosylation ligase, exosortase A system-associated [Nitrospirota bacterium]
MSLRDAFVILVVIGSLPLCFLKPWFGVLMWSWLGYMNPHRLTWGMAYSMPFAQMVGIATLAGLVLGRERLRVIVSREVVLLVALWGWFLITTIFSTYPDDAWPFLWKVSKIFLMTFVTIIAIQDKQKLKWLLYVIALSIGFYGLKGGIWAILTGAKERVLGPPGSFIAGNTEIGLALVMVLPLLIFLRRDESRPWLRHLLLGTGVLSVVAILSTYSRGALLALIAVLGMIFLKSRTKVLTLAVIIVATPIVLTMLPQKWFERMETIDPDKKESSAMQRLDAWTMAFYLALDNPVFGAGFRCFTPEMYERYYPEAMVKRVDAHSIVFQVLAEHGFIGIGLYLGLMASTFLSLRRIIRIARRDPSRRWMLHYAQMLEAGLVGFLVGGLFLSRSYFDLYYHFVAAAVILQRLGIYQQATADRSSAFSRSSITNKTAANPTLALS